MNLAGSLRFCVIADVHYADKPPQPPRRYRDALLRLREFAADCRQSPPAFVVLLGDLIDGGPDAQADMNTVLEVLSEEGLPERVHVLGNHDFVGLSRRTVMTLLGMERSYFDFEKAGRRFLVLDTVEISAQGGWDEKSRPFQTALEMIESLRSRGAENARFYNGAVGPTQLEWLDGLLGRCDADRQPVIVFGHLPLLPEGQKHTLFNSDEVLNVLEAHRCVQVYMSGHRHEGADTCRGGIHHVGLEAMVESSRSGGWADLRWTDNTLEIRGVGNVRSRTVPLS